MTAREYLFSLELVGIKLGLEQIRRLLAALDRPDQAFPSIIVAGTNGKGSVTAMLERGLRAAGYRTGRYTSPHLTHIEERVAIDGAAISASEFDALAGCVREAAATLPAPPSFFEAMTALALLAFRDADVDIAVLEVGLGGRLDATNAVTPTLSVITAIDLDHQKYLGDTIEQIASEKAGILRPHVSAVLGANRPAVRAVVARIAGDLGAPLTYAPDTAMVRQEISEGQTTLSVDGPAGPIGPVRLGLRGRHQIDNAITALTAFAVLDATRLRVPLSARASALTDVQWPARLETRVWHAGAAAHALVIDGAHNPGGAAALASYLTETFARPLPIVFAAMHDKDITGLIDALRPAASAFVCTGLSSPRAASARTLVERVRALAPDLTVLEAARPAEALALAAPLGAPIVVAGSLYLAGEVRELLS